MKELMPLAWVTGIAMFGLGLYVMVDGAIILGLLMWGGGVLAVFTLLEPPRRR